MKTLKNAVPVTKRVSMEQLALNLLTVKASEKTIISAFVKAYKGKGKMDRKFVTVRIKIYMKIADKNYAAAVKAASAPKVKRPTHNAVLTIVEHVIGLDSFGNATKAQKAEQAGYEAQLVTMEVMDSKGNFIPSWSTKLDTKIDALVG